MSIGGRGAYFLENTVISLCQCQHYIMHFWIATHHILTDLPGPSGVQADADNPISRVQVPNFSNHLDPEVEVSSCCQKTSAENNKYFMPKIFCVINFC